MLSSLPSTVVIPCPPDVTVVCEYTVKRSVTVVAVGAARSAVYLCTVPMHVSTSALPTASCPLRKSTSGVPTVTRAGVAVPAVPTSMLPKLDCRVNFDLRPYSY